MSRASFVLVEITIIAVFKHFHFIDDRVDRIIWFLFN
jgi:hypothetical protein